MNFIKLSFIIGLISISHFIEAQTINSERSKVNFSLKNMGIRTVEGNFTGMKGNVSFEENDLSVCTFDVCIDAASVDTDNQKRDDHLRKDDFFGVGQFPTICFVSESVSKSKKGYLANGKLTMHGITKSVEIPFTFDGSTFVGNFEVKRKDYGVGNSYGNFMVGNRVKVEIVCVVE